MISSLNPFLKSNLFDFLNRTYSGHTKSSRTLDKLVQNLFLIIQEDHFYEQIIERDAHMTNNESFLLFHNCHVHFLSRT